MGRKDNYLLRRAMNIAQTSLDEQSYKHGILTAQILSLVTDDVNVIAAGYIHQVLEKSPIMYSDLIGELGHKVADLVVETTSTDDNTYPMLHTIPAIMIKFASRIASLAKTIDTLPSEQQEMIKRSQFWQTKGKNN